MRAVVGAVLLAVLMAGCVRLSQPAPTIRDYRLDYDPPTIPGKRLPTILGVPPLRVAATYDRDLIVYREGGYATGTYFYERWSANPGSMVADLLARDLTASGLYGAVQQGLSAVPMDYQLTGEIEAIEERVAASGCAAHFAMRILLLRLRANRAEPVVLQKTYAGDEPCPCANGQALAAAMSRILERLSSQLQADVYSGIAADFNTTPRH